MSAAEYDVVIVGARCAGASLATLLSRAGVSVLLLDKDPLPSDQIISTHTIHPPGIDVLDEWALALPYARSHQRAPGRSFAQERRSC